MGQQESAVALRSGELPLQGSINGGASGSDLKQNITSKQLPQQSPQQLKEIEGKAQARTTIGLNGQTRKSTETTVAAAVTSQKPPPARNVVSVASSTSVASSQGVNMSVEGVREVVDQVVGLLQRNQAEIIERIESGVERVLSSFEERIDSIEKRLESIHETQMIIETTTREGKVVGENQEAATTQILEGIDALRSEVRQIVAISEKYIKDDSKLQHISGLNLPPPMPILGKTIVKESKEQSQQHIPRPKNHISSYSEKRERSKIMRQMQDSSILQELNQSQPLPDVRQSEDDSLELQQTTTFPSTISKYFSNNYDGNNSTADSSLLFNK